MALQCRIKMFKTIKLLFKNKIGLVLSGGGAKGAYQVGVFRALQELGIDNRVKVVSGTSIGALNGALFLMKDPKVWMDTWQDANFENFLSLGEEDLSPKRTFKHLHALVKRSFQDIEDDWKNSKDIEEFILSRGLSLFSQKGLADVIKDNLNLNEVSKHKTKFYACAYNTNLSTPEYFFLNKQKTSHILKVLLASACIPFLYPPVEIGEHEYMDGGVHIPLYKENNIDNVPVTPIINSKCDIIIIVYLNHDESMNDELRQKLKKKIVLEIYPSQPLEVIKGTGSFDFSRGSLNERIELGYHDAMFIIAPMLVKLLQGQKVDHLIANLNEYNAHTRKKFTE